MKRHLLAAAVALLAVPVVAYAQASAVPTLISYQGKVTDAGGLLIGSPTPVNRVVTFRVWDSPSAVGASNRLYTEQQTVTIANGEFSVLLGNGTELVGEENTRALNEVFDGSTRFLGLTIDDPAVTTDPEITPRQQIATTAYAFRAQVAETVANQAVTGTMLANNAVSTAQVADAAITTGKLATNAVETAKIVDNAVTADKIAAGSVTAAKLGPDVGVWAVNGTTVYRPNLTAVAIGSTYGFAPLGVFEGAPFNAPRISFQNDNTGTGFTEGTYLGTNGLNAYLMNNEVGFLDLGTNKLIRQRFETDGRIGFGVLNGDPNLDFYFKGARLYLMKVQNAAGAESFTVRDNGSIAVGHAGALNLPGSVDVFHTTYPNLMLHSNSSGTGGGDGVAVFYDAANGNSTFHRSGIWNFEPGMMDFATNNVRRMRIENDGRMGFGLDNGDGNVSFYFMGRTKTTSGGPANQHVTMRIVNPDFSEVAAFRADGTAFKPGGGSWAASSDARLKHDVSEIDDALDKFSLLRPVRFFYNDPEKYGQGERSGFIAQEMETVFPEWVTSTEDGYKAISFSGFEAYAVEAINSLRAEKDAEIAARDARIQTLEDRLAKLEAKLEASVTSR